MSSTQTEAPQSTSASPRPSAADPGGPLVAALDIDIPDEAFYHPAVVELGSIATEIITLDNVSFSRRRINHSDP